MFKKLKVIILYLLFNLYFLFNYKYIIDIIEFVGGTIFVKIFQLFTSFNNFNSNDDFSGTIGSITKYDNSIKKTLHANINIKFKDSLLILKNLLEFSKMELPFNFDEYININMEQIDLIKEHHNSIKLKKIFQNIDNVKVINIYYSCSKYHMSDYINGYNIKDFLEIKTNQKYLREIIYLLHLSYYLMLSKNIFHCDWHTGNFLVNVVKEKIVLYILDTGLMGSITDNKHLNKLKTLLSTNILYLEPINVIKFLSFINLNKDANINNFIKDSKDIAKKYKIEKNFTYKNSIIEIIKNASKNKLRFQIVVLYMFQGLIFLDGLLINNDCCFNDILKFSKSNGFYKEIQKALR